MKRFTRVASCVYRFESGKTELHFLCVQDLSKT